MKKFAGGAISLCLLVAVAAPTFAAPPYKIPPGQYCKALSKKKIPGQKKTPFAQCTSAMAKVDKGTSPAKACKGLLTGAKGTKGKKAARKAFGQCQAAGKKLKADKTAT
jgi:hypothetical protein